MVSVFEDVKFAMRCSAYVCFWVGLVQQYSLLSLSVASLDLYSSSNSGI